MNNKDVIIKLDGRMDNQMFQWAFARGYEAKNGIMPIFDDSKETLKLTPFKLSQNIKTVEKPLWNKFLRKTVPFRNLRNKLTELKFNLPHFEEEVICLFQPNLFDIKAPAFISGYFQCEKYFIDVKEQLINDFQLIEPLSNANQNVLDKIKNTNSVSIHFRYGDFLKSRVAKNFGNLGEKYYQDAIKYIAENTNEPLTLFIFSDDINLVKENIKFEHETVYVDINSGKQGYFDIELMKNCKNNIIANSSFSWWGAWLNENPNKIVAAPSPVRPNKPDYDRIPDSWIKCNSYFGEVKNNG